MYKYFILILLFITSCSTNKVVTNHGSHLIIEKSKKLIVNKSNKNDIINTLGPPSSKSTFNDNTWIYIERTLSKGEYHKLGQNILKTNNVLILEFDKFGILKEKKFLDKNDKNKLAFAEMKTENNLTQKSFIEKFLTSMRSKMYGNK